MAIKAVLVDVGGVLVVPHEEPVGEALQSAHIDVRGADFQRAHYAAMASVDRGSIPGTGLPYIHAFVDALGVEPGQRHRAMEVLDDLFARPATDVWRRVLPESVQGLRNLSERGFPLGVVSNADGTVEELLLRSRICQVGVGAGVQVLVIIDSAVVGVAKPDPRIFSFAVDALGLPPRDIAFVGDSFLSDVLGARAAGLLPIHFDPYDMCANKLGHRHIEALAEISWELPPGG